MCSCGLCLGCRIEQERRDRVYLRQVDAIAALDRIEAAYKEKQAKA